MLFSLVNISALWYTSQTKIVDIIRSFDLSHCTSLAMITGQAEGQHIVSAFQNRVVTVVPLDTALLSNLYANHVKVMDNGDVSSIATTFVSEMAGAGKTHKIHMYVAEKHLNYKHIPVVGPIAAEQLIQLLERDHGTDTGPSAFHIDIGPNASADLNDLLFQLLISGLLQDASGHLYHRKTGDVFLIELPNVFQGKNQTKPGVHGVEFLEQLPVIVSVFSADDFDLYKNELSSSGGKITFSRVPNYELQFVCKYLQAFQNQVFAQFKAEDEDFHPDITEDVDGASCFNLLHQITAGGTETEEGDTSYVIFTNFLRFSFPQFVNVTYYELLTNMAVAGALGCPPFKHFIIDFLVKTGVDFSTKAVSRSAQLQGNAIIEEESHNTLRLSTQEIFATRFDRMRHWEDSDHPFVVLNQAAVQLTDILPGGIGIISLNPDLIDQTMDRNMKELLAFNGFNFDTDYRKITKEDAINLLCVVLGAVHVQDMQPQYVLTFDNMMKMISIQLRVKCDIPAVIMGETGCGKTALIRYLCEFINVPLFILDVHGGITDEYITEWMQKPIAQAKADRSRDFYVFFDEINTCNSMSLFKNIICDRSMNGMLLPSNMKFIAACNPYRLLTEQDTERERIGLVFQQKNALEVIPDPLSHLVYR